MKVKYIIVLYILGNLLSLFGSLLKIEHLPLAREIILISYLIQAISLVVLLYKLFTYPKFKEFLNW